MKGLVIDIIDSEDNLLMYALYEFLQPILDEIDPLYWCFDDDIQPDVKDLSWLWGKENEEDGTSDGVLFDYLVDQEIFRDSLATHKLMRQSDMSVEERIRLREASFIGADIFDIYRPHMMKTFGFALNEHGFGEAHFYCGFPAETDKEAFNKINEICTNGDPLNVQYIFDLRKIMEHKAMLVIQCNGKFRIFAEEKYLEQLKKNYEYEEMDSDNLGDISSWTSALSFAFIN